MNLLEKIPKFLSHMLEEQYGQEITKKILEGYQSQRKVTLRVNTLKTTAKAVKQALEKVGLEIREVAWSENAFILQNATELQLKKLDIYQKGEIYLQSLSSMLPPIILEPKPRETILDMTAAPGGKTTQIAAISNNQSLITACELHAIRAERLKFNIEKQGVTCAYVMITDARKLDDLFSFDKILLDAPCSGSGTITLEKKNCQEFLTENLIQKTTKNQITLLKKAITLLKPGEEMVYSTCSILKEENEEVLKKAIQGTKAKVVPIAFKGLETIPQLPTKIKGTLCVLPNEYYEGFFVAKIKKEEI